MSHPSDPLHCPLPPRLLPPRPLRWFIRNQDSSVLELPVVLQVDSSRRRLHWETRLIEAMHTDDAGRAEVALNMPQVFADQQVSAPPPPLRRELCRAGQLHHRRQWRVSCSLLR